MHLTPEDLKKLGELEGWAEDAVRGTIKGMRFDILAEEAARVLNSAGQGTPTTPTSASTCVRDENG